jgi:O-glycosyl hydrolase
VDYFFYLEWESQAKSDTQITVANQLTDSGIAQEDDMLFSWLIHYDPLTKSKERADGYSVYSPNTRELFIKIDDPANQTVDEWTLNVHNCKSTGTNKPVFIAANVDLT